LESRGVEASEKVSFAISLWRKEYVGIFLACRDNTRDYEFASGHLEFQLDKIRSYFLTQSNREGKFPIPFVGIYYFWGEFARVTVPFIMGGGALTSWAVSACLPI